MPPVSPARILASSAGALLLLCSASGTAAPPLWSASDGDSTIYIFGSVHVLKPGTVWRTPELIVTPMSERQLLYEACTRARERLMVSGVAPGSEFLADLR